MTWFLSKGINVLESPSNSPDLNPIENIWKEMKSKIHRACCTLIPELMTELKRGFWIQDMSLQYFQKLSESMLKCIEMVLKNKGQMTKY